MSDLRTLFTEDHRYCDDLLGEAETCMAQSDGVGAQEKFRNFQAAMLRHFQVEEEQLFPAFEQETGVVNGPTRIMRMEHVQMRQLMDDALAALVAGDNDEYLGVVETLVIMMQQHNMKEENVLYPMCEQALSAQCAALLPTFESALSGG